ncbi:MAG: DEAD/DEAH box helicase [Myxococcales bacterium]|nr:DEAD/DEAH box helicase [Myxococcales bacterium]
MEAVASSWRADRRVGPCFVLDEVIPAREAREVRVMGSLAQPVRRALERRGIARLYSHQAEAVELALSGKDVVVATPTASGKSLCYNLPVLDALARDGEARALYLFPTKALSRDQEEALRAFLAEAGLEQGAITFDGDTPADARRAARDRAKVIVTNPDMLHAGVLPHHASWARLFANLRYVVVDELHSYRGVFGSHVANVLRRLERVARFHGSQPRFLFASATIGNPKEHAERMLGRELALVDQCGAPAGARKVMVYQPPVVNPELGLRESYVKAAARLTADLVRARVTTLLFGQSRNTVEVMLKYLRDRLASDRIDPTVLHAYRGGYLPATRREIESRLREGELRCVVATNALELGIDVGALDAVVCAGYPGSMAALWQRFGRAGRRQTESLALLVTSSAPVDQYVASEAKGLLCAPVEQARIDPDNVEILVQHIKCAAFELPFAEGESFREVSAQGTGETLEFLASHRVVHPVPGEQGRRVYHWSADAYPANEVSLRSVGWDNFVVVDLEAQKTIAEMDWRSAHTMLHEQAIYQHEGSQLQVERLDFENHKAFVRKVEPDYFTQAMTHTRVEVLSEAAAARCEGGASFGTGEVSVVEKVVGYKKIKFHTHENVGYGEVALPEIQKHTTAFWMIAPEEVLEGLRASRADLLDAFRGIGHALHTVACVGLMIDPRDLGSTVGSRADPSLPPQKGGEAMPTFEPALFLYDHVPGGVGLGSRLYDEREELLRRGRRLIESCACPSGCPGCIGPPAGIASPRWKALARSLIAALGAPPSH